MKLCLDQGTRSKVVLVAAQISQLTHQVKVGKDCGCPSLTFQDGVIHGWSTILRHIARNSKLYGDNTHQNSTIDDWLDTILYELEFSCSQLNKAVEGKASLSKAEFNQHLENLNDFIKLLNKFIAGKNSITSKLSIADIAVYGAIYKFLNSFGDNVWKQKNKQVYRYMKQLSSIKAFQALKLVQCQKSFKFQEKKPEKKIQKKQEKKEPKKQQKKQKKQKKQQKKEEQDDDDAPKQKKQKSQLDSLPKSDFVIDDFKRQFVNVPKQQRLNTLNEHFWKKFDKSGWSIWKIYYQKYQGQGQKEFLTCNLKNGFLQRLDHFRKYSFAVHGVYGDQPNLQIRGVWFWRGTGIPDLFKQHPSYEYHTITQLNPENQQDRKLLESYWLNLEQGEQVQGLKVREAKWFK